MSIQDFSEQQKQALLDLTLLAMYADGHLAAAEDERVNRLLDTMGFATAWDRTKNYDASVSRVRQHLQTAESARAYAVALARNFATPGHQGCVQTALDDVVASDGRVSRQENSFLRLVREALGS